MRKALFVAEKNDVAKGVASILSNGTSNRKEGRSIFNKIYTLNTELFGQRTAVSVTSVSGHMMNFQFHENMSNWQTTSMVELFEAPVRHVVMPDMKLIEQTLREEAQRHDLLVVWTDCDREGEAIGAEIVKVCRESNRRIDIFRARFSEITKTAITRAAQNLIRLDERTVAAVDCRSELDLRIGSAFTRLQTLHLRNRFRDLLGQNENSKVISYGSCQFPTLGFVTDRYKLIENFISEPFWKLSVEHSREGHKVEFLWDRNRLFDREVVDILHDECKEAKEAHVEKVTKKPKSKWRPQGLDTVELEKLGISKLRISQLHGDDWKVYELVVRHFLACVSQDAQGEETMVNLSIGSEKFHSSGLRIRDMGYLKVYIYEKWGNRLLPTYTQDERFSDYQLKIGDGKTQPPDLLTEADLIALMDKFGIGTDATHAEHIEKIKSREYIGVKPDGKLIPSFLGLALVDGYDDMGFAMSKPDLRANLEIQLNEICNGRRQKQDVLNEQIGKYKTIFVESERNIEVLSQSLQRYLNKNQQIGGGGGGNGGGGGPPRGPGGGGGGGGSKGPPKPPPKPRGRPPNKSVTPTKDDDQENDTITTLSEVLSNLKNPKPARKSRAKKSVPKADASKKGQENEFEEEEEVMCTCAEPMKAIIKVVQKEGPNKGKKFYTCSLPYTSSDKCNFFKWV
ncbi:hypothetical protein GCK72_010188 [Caenorhabditis remanei]|uniref:DNA topoisomerase n=1 Tax=Caenorhabditis remanei TaxID=31234 RepID=A0A6A5H4I7_CAERE|nr:hypothetical protein GCK72_010188 [Caenorhabditis remanei]KAF1761929.1 hypothetical protein GCK72_010188 [Caenorhabditis remanei]